MGACVLKEANDPQAIHSGGYSNDNIASSQSHVIKDGSSVVSQVWCVRSANCHMDSSTDDTDMMMVVG